MVFDILLLLTLVVNTLLKIVESLKNASEIRFAIVATAVADMVAVGYGVIVVVVVVGGGAGDCSSDGCICFVVLFVVVVAIVV